MLATLKRRAAMLGYDAPKNVAVAHSGGLVAPYEPMDRLEAAKELLKKLRAGAAKQEQAEGLLLGATVKEPT